MEIVNSFDDTKKSIDYYLFAKQANLFGAQLEVNV